MQPTSLKRKFTDDEEQDRKPPVSTSGRVTRSAARIILDTPRTRRADTLARPLFAKPVKIQNDALMRIAEDRANEGMIFRQSRGTAPSFSPLPCSNSANFVHINNRNNFRAPNYTHSPSSLQMNHAQIASSYKQTEPMMDERTFWQTPGKSTGLIASQKHTPVHNLRQDAIKSVSPSPTQLGVSTYAYPQVVTPTRSYVTAQEPMRTDQQSPTPSRPLPDLSAFNRFREKTPEPPAPMSTAARTAALNDNPLFMSPHARARKVTRTPESVRSMNAPNAPCSGRGSSMRKAANGIFEMSLDVLSPSKAPRSMTASGYMHLGNIGDVVGRVDAMIVMKSPLSRASYKRTRVE